VGGGGGVGDNGEDECSPSTYTTIQRTHTLRQQQQESGQRYEVARDQDKQNTHPGTQLHAEELDDGRSCNYAAQAWHTFFRQRVRERHAEKHASFVPHRPQRSDFGPVRIRGGYGPTNSYVTGPISHCIFTSWCISSSIGLIFVWEPNKPSGSSQNAIFPW